MKHRSLLIYSYRAVLIFIVILSIQSCGKFDLFKDMSESVPVVEMVTVETRGDTTIIIGKVIDKGAYDVSLCGFCFSTSGAPEVDDNQILLNGTNDDFGVMVLDMYPDSTYYISAFAYNDFAYSVSDPVQYSIPHQGPPEIPCNIDDNLIIDNGIYSPLNNIYAGQNVGIGGSFGVSVMYSNNYELVISFNGRPNNGVYTTGFWDETDKIYVTLNKGMVDISIKDDGLIYVEEIGDNSFSVTFCDLAYTAFSSEFPLAGRIIVEMPE